MVGLAVKIVAFVIVASAAVFLLLCIVGVISAPLWITAWYRQNKREKEMRAREMARIRTAKAVPTYIDPGHPEALDRCIASYIRNRKNREDDDQGRAVLESLKDFKW